MKLSGNPGPATISSSPGTTDQKDTVYRKVNSVLLINGIPGRQWGQTFAPTTACPAQQHAEMTIEKFGYLLFQACLEGVDVKIQQFWWHDVLHDCFPVYVLKFHCLYKSSKENYVLGFDISKTFCNFSGVKYL